VRETSRQRAEKMFYLELEETAHHGKVDAPSPVFIFKNIVFRGVAD
jgi:hypothetical protein